MINILFHGPEAKAIISFLKKIIQRPLIWVS